MKTNILISLILLCALLNACNSKEDKKSPELYEPAKTITEDSVKRGEYLVNSNWMS